MIEERRGLAWAHGVLAVERRGAMLAPVCFTLADGRQVAPFHVAPWFDEKEAKGLSGLMPRLRGEWPCIPFGFDQDRPALGDWPASRVTEAVDEGHGFGANGDWTFLDAAPGTLALSIDYPAGHPIARLERRILPDERAPALDIELTVHPRADCRLPVGLHPTFRLPREPGAFEIELDGEAELATFPGEVDASSILETGRFAEAAALPLKAGGTLDIRRLPLERNTEELVQVLDAGGAVTLNNHAEAYRLRLSWNQGDFPSLLLWVSNRGRAFAPWNGGHLALGVEPVCSAFDLGSGMAAASNPLNRRGIPTARNFRAGMAWTTRYRVAVEASGTGHD